MQASQSTPPPSSPLPPQSYLSNSFTLLAQHGPLYTDSNAKILLSPNQKFFAAWNSGNISILDISTAQITRTILSDQDDEFLAFALSPNNKFLATISRKTNTIKQWELENDSATPVQSFRAQTTQPIMDCCYDGSGLLLACAGADKTIKIYDLAKKHQTHNIKQHSSRVMHVWFHPVAAKLLLISAGENGELIVTDLRSNQSKFLLSHMSLVTDIDISRDHSILISASRDKVVNIWDLHSFSLKFTIPVYEPLESIKFWPSQAVELPEEAQRKLNPNSLYHNFFLTGGEKGELRLWDANTQDCVYNYSLGSNNSNNSSANSEKNIANQVAYMFLRLEAGANGEEQSKNKTMQIIVVTKEQNLLFYTPNFHRNKLIIGNNDEIIDIKTFPDNNHAAIATNSAEIRIFNVHTLSSELLSSHSDTVLALDISANGQFLVSVSKDCTVRWWSLPNYNNSSAEINPAQCVAVCQGHAESIGAVSLNKSLNSLNSGHFFAVSGARDRTIKLWDARELLGHDHLAGKSAKLYEIPAVQSKLAHEKDINAISVAPNDRITATASEDKTIKLWNNWETTGNTKKYNLSLLATLRGHKRGVWAVKFSPVDKVLASASGDKTIKIWNLTDFSCIKTLEGHLGPVKSLSWLNYGQQLLSAADDELIKLWNIKTSAVVANFSGSHADKIWALATTPNERIFLSGGADSLLNIWLDNTEQRAQEELQQKNNLMMAEQQLNNQIKLKSWRKAVFLAIQLEMPRKLLQILNEIILQEKQNNHAEGAQQILHDVVRKLNETQLNRLISYILDWNTNSKSALSAQTLLHIILQLFSQDSLLKQCRNLSENLPALLSYTEKHFNRIEKLIQNTYTIDFILEAANIIQPLQQITAQETREPRDGQEREEKEEIGQEDKEITKQVLGELLSGDLEKAISPALHAKSSAQREKHLKMSPALLSLVPPRPQSAKNSKILSLQKLRGGVDEAKQEEEWRDILGEEGREEGEELPGWEQGEDWDGSTTQYNNNNNGKNSKKEKHKRKQEEQKKDDAVETKKKQKKNTKAKDSAEEKPSAAVKSKPKAKK